MPVNLADLPDKIDINKLPHHGLDLSALPDQDDNSFPTHKVAASAVQSVENVVSPKDINLQQIISEAVKSPEARAVAEGGKKLADESAVGMRMIPETDVGKLPSTPGNPVFNALHKPQDMIQKATQEKLIKSGVNPYLAMFGGMAAGQVADPINLIAVAEVGGGVNEYLQFRKALKASILEGDAVRAKFAADQTGSYEEWLKEKAPLNREVPETPSLTETSYSNQSQQRPLSGVVKAEGQVAKEKGMEEVGATVKKALGKDPEDTRLFTGYKPAESVVSEETQNLPHPESMDYAPTEPPTKLAIWMNSAVKELGDLHTSLDLTAPTQDPHADLIGTYRRFVQHQKLARLDADQMMEHMATYVPEKERRTLVTLYSQLGHAPTQDELTTILEATAGMKDPGVKDINESMEKLLGQNLSLSDHEQVVLKSYNSYFDGVGQKAQEMGIIPRLREAYGGPHVYMPAEEASRGVVKRILTGRTKFASPRTFDNVLEAVQNKHLPRTLDSAELLGIYHRSVSRAAAEKYFMGALEKQGLINYAGEGRQVRAFQPAVKKLGEELYTKQPYSENPEVQKVVGHATEELHPIFDTSFMRALNKFYAFKRSSVLFLQLFHPKALATEAVGEGFSPAKFVEGLKMIDQNPEAVRTLVRAGLEINTARDLGDEIATSVTKNYKGLNPIAMGRKVNDVFQSGIFRKYLTGLKIYDASRMAERFRNMGGGMITGERAAQLAVENSNRIFGGLNLELMMRSPNMQRVFKMLSFAPDWTESKALQVAGAFGKGFGEVSPLERLMLTKQSRSYWYKLTALATVTHLADQINPANRVVSIDMAQESGFKDVTKMLKVLGGDFTYFRSKESPMLRDYRTWTDPKMPIATKVQKSLVEDLLPINLEKLIFGVNQ